MLLTLVLLLLLEIQNGICKKQGDRCVLKNTNTAGVCTPATDCDSVRDDYHNKGIRPTYCTRNFDNILVCCTGNQSVQYGPTTEEQKKIVTVDPRPVWGGSYSTPNRTPNRTPNNKKRISERKCEEYSLHVTESVPFIALSTNPEKMTVTGPKCDYNGVELIVGGKKTDQGEFPHMAAIGWVDVEGKHVFHCGGSLISSRFVLTAGHCTRTPNRKLRDPRPSIVRLGDQNLDPFVRDNANPIDVEIKAIHKHPGYVSPSKYNDIALLELPYDVDFDRDLRPACLWTKPSFPGYTRAIATGWGVVNPNNPTKTSDELQKVALTLLENDSCNISLIETFHRHFHGLSDSQMCAGEVSGGKDTCQGDSGSPLQVASFDNKCIFHIIGVTSFGKHCAVMGKPAVYTRVSSYLDWIEGIVWPGE